MEKEFVPYEIALELKELGFDEKCLTYYFSDGVFNDAAEEDDTLHPGDPRFHSDTNSSLAEYLENELKYKAIAAPTFSQAFRWFREKYSMHGLIYPYSERDSGKYGWMIWFIGNTEDGHITNVSCSMTDANIELGTNRCWNPEEAELECLKKLIEIVKTLKMED